MRLWETLITICHHFLTFYRPNNLLINQNIYSITAVLSFSVHGIKVAMIDHAVTSRMADSSRQQAIRISYLKKSRGFGETGKTALETKLWPSFCGCNEEKASRKAPGNVPGNLTK